MQTTSCVLLVAELVFSPVNLANSLHTSALAYIFFMLPLADIQSLADKY